MKTGIIIVSNFQVLSVFFLFKHVIVIFFSKNCAHVPRIWKLNQCRIDSSLPSFVDGDFQSESLVIYSLHSTATSFTLYSLPHTYQIALQK